MNFQNLKNKLIFKLLKTKYVKMHKKLIKKKKVNIVFHKKKYNQ